MARKPFRLIPILVAAVVVRAMTSHPIAPMIEVPPSTADARAVQRAIAAGGPLPSSIGSQSPLRRMVRLRYDADAALIVTVGPDGRPGAAGLDDGNNGVIDDRDEIGATESDDGLLALSPEALDRYGDAHPASDYKRIGRGALVPAGDGSADFVAAVYGDGTQIAWSSSRLQTPRRSP